MKGKDVRLHNKRNINSKQNQ